MPAPKIRSKSTSWFETGVALLTNAAVDWIPNSLQVWGKKQWGRGDKHLWNIDVYLDELSLISAVCSHTDKSCVVRVDF